MFTIELLPASQGDALWLSWGDDDRPHHLLIDAGPRRNALRDLLRSRIAERITTTGGRLELLVVTHIDADHIGGVLHLFADGPPCEIGDVWFNGYEHHDPQDVLGAKQAEAFSQLLVDHRLPWNEAFDGDAVAVPDGRSAPVSTTELDGGLRLSVLGPTRKRLTELVPDWRDECEAAGIVPGVALDDPTPQPDDTLGDAVHIDDPDDVAALAAQPFERDPSTSNAASITLLAEFGGRSVLLTGDALAGDVVAGLDRLSAERRDPVAVHALKVPHHGSSGNVTTELVDRVAAPHHLFSSDGGGGHGHPSAAAVARVVTAGTDRVELHFNYASPHTEPWRRPTLRRAHGYRPRYPAGDDGITLDLRA